MYKDSYGGVTLYNAENLTTKVLMTNSTFVSIAIEHFNTDLVVHVDLVEVVAHDPRKGDQSNSTTTLTINLPVKLTVLWFGRLLSKLRSVFDLFADVYVLCVRVFFFLEIYEVAMGVQVGNCKGAI